MIDFLGGSGQWMDKVELDFLDRLASEVFAGYVVRKDLARRFKGRYPAPEYVAEFLLGRYCASTDEAEIAEGLGIVELQMRERTVRPGEEEQFNELEFGGLCLVASTPMPTPRGFQPCDSRS